MKKKVELARGRKKSIVLIMLKTLKYLPNLTHENLDNHLIKGSSTVPIVSIGPKASRNRKQGYWLRKERYVRNIFVKPNFSAKCKLCEIKSARIDEKYTIYKVRSLESDQW